MGISDAFGELIPRLLEIDLFRNAVAVVGPSLVHKLVLTLSARCFAVPIGAGLSQIKLAEPLERPVISCSEKP